MQPLNRLNRGSQPRRPARVRARAQRIRGVADAVDGAAECQQRVVDVRRAALGAGRAAPEAPRGAVLHAAIVKRAQVRRLVDQERGTLGGLAFVK